MYPVLKQICYVGMLDTQIQGCYLAQAYSFFCKIIPTYVYLNNTEILIPCYTQFPAPFFLCTQKSIKRS